MLDEEVRSIRILIIFSELASLDRSRLSAADFVTITVGIFKRFSAGLLTTNSSGMGAAVTPTSFCFIPDITKRKSYSMKTISDQD